MGDWLSKEALTWVSIGSGLCLLFGAVAVPWIVLKLPKNAFSEVKRRPGWLDQQPAVIRLPIRIFKNVLALALIVIGIVMLVLPGQGILAILLGVMLGDFPGKLRLQQWIVARPKVMNSLNWLRRKFRKPPLERPSAKMAA
jgi:uncharacterized membrane protein SpoIIM required for sporulation